MKTLVVFCSNHGTTEKAVKHLVSQLPGEIKSIDLKREKIKVDINEFEYVLIGGSIHAGQIQGKLRSFMKNNMEILLHKKLGLFLCCMQEGETAQKQFEQAFPKELRKKAIVHGLFGGEFLVTKMNFIEKAIVKKVSGVVTDTSALNTKAIKEFVNQLENHMDVVH
ncbi:flavodoxin domain-containing protein [Bacillus changyiensis]|uniref:flavodoxin domain-containing protein n=1 Tax=Bacillus changyiensis TaxID=3004103 RepID=UPI0022E13ADD|nr:flavodoxin domain-containing protein [Bacillus changyiensis]MDA1478018.1 flavodoxin [Bacillus changyiensis]